MRAKALVITLFIATAAFAQNPRSFVSTTGNDANTCTPGLECRSFSKALSVTNPGGEVIAISSGGYGVFTISQGVTVTAAPGVYAATSVPSAGTGVAVTAGATERVVIRGLNFTMFGNSSKGISATTFGTLSIEGCAITGGGTSAMGVEIAREDVDNAAITDTVVRSGYTGFRISSPATLLRCRAENNSNIGLLVLDGTLADGNVTAVDYTGVGNDIGATAVASAGLTHRVVMNLQRAFISNNGSGVISQASNSAQSYVVISESVVTHHSNYGLQQVNTGVLGTAGNNLLFDNAPMDTTGTIVPFTLQ